MGLGDGDALAFEFVHARVARIADRVGYSLTAAGSSASASL